MRSSFILLLLSLAAPAAALPDSRSLDFALSSGAITAACASAKAGAEARLKDIEALKDPRFRSALVPFSDILADLQDETAIPMFLGHVSQDKGARDAGMDCDTEISKYLVEVFTREGLYAAIKAAAERGEVLDGEDARLMEKTLLDFRRSGLSLPPAERERLKGLRQKLVALQNDFQKEVAETRDFALFSKEQLSGLPEDFVKRLPREGDRYTVTLDYPDYFPFIENAKDPGARRILEAKFNLRGGPKNKERLMDILGLRAEAARLLGYKTHADYVLEERMAQRPSEVFSFLERLRAPLQAKGRAELKTLAALKNAEEGAKSDGIVRAWDWRYYHNQLMKTRYQVDQQKLKEYFPMDLVVEQMLAVYQELLGLKFREIVPSGAWHPDVRQFEISDSRTGVSIARFYMDLYPREGKYKHAAAFTLIQGRVLPEGSYRKPSSAIVANFNKPTAEAPSLLTHDEVETFFHEFGHIMHQTLTRAKYQRFSGTSVARDFVESASQIFENWVWKEDILTRLSGHYQDRSRKLGKEMIKKLVDAKLVDSGLKYLRQNFFGTYDMTLHTLGAQDTTALYAKLMGEISLIPMSPGVMPETSFNHLMGYDAGYYGYLWSEVFAQDMFTRFEREGLLNEKTGRDYRRQILEVGGSREESESLRAFLGRDPGDEAFLKDLGISSRPVRRQR